jgi:GDP-L-fucose synthase
MSSYWMTQRVLVTGGTGFLGTHVVQALREEGCERLTVVRSRDYDLTREDEVVRLFADTRPDVVFHLAGRVGGIRANMLRPADFFYDNLMMGTLLLHHASQRGVHKFIAAGAGCGYPEHAPLPLRETNFWDGFPQRESAPYSLAKRLLHVQALAYHQQHGFVTIIGIPGNIYGPNDNFDLEHAHAIPALVRKFAEAVDEGRPETVVWGTGRPTRDFVYAGDVARGLLLAAERYDAVELVNLSSGVETSIREVVEHLVDLLGFEGRVVWDRSRPDGQARRCFDIAKAGRDLGFEAAVPLRRGLASTADWFRANRLTARV